MIKLRSKGHGLPLRVYLISNTYWWVSPVGKKWVKLCRAIEGETRMLERLVEEKRKREIDATIGSMSRLVQIYMEAAESEYADSFRKEWRRRGEAIVKAFAAFDIQQVDAGAVDDFLKSNWPDKLPTQRAMHGWLSKFFAWAVVRRHVLVNPCREVSVKKPKVRRVYIKSNHFLAIRAGLLTYTYTKKIKGEERTITAQVPSGAMMQVFVDLCYLTCQRSTDIRSLLKSDVDWQAGVIHFLPSKTEDSTGDGVDWPITPEIEVVLRRAEALAPSSRYVVCDELGEAKTDAACRDAWRDGMRRAGLEEIDYTVKNIRAKALTDAKKMGYKIDDLQVAGVHADRATTEGYIKSREVPVSVVRLALPDDSNLKSSNLKTVRATQENEKANIT